MSTFIEELKKEHVEIINLLESVKKMRFFKQEEERNIFLKAKQLIGSHMINENVRLYPLLIEAGKTDIRLKKMLDNFASDMEIVSEEIMQFLDRYSSGIPDREFAKDYGKTIALLKSRMRHEEIILYKEYDRIMI